MLTDMNAVSISSYEWYTSGKMVCCWIAGSTTIILIIIFGLFQFIVKHSVHYRHSPQCIHICDKLPTSADSGVCHPLHADSGCVSPPTPPFADAPDCCNGCSFWCSLFSSVMWKNIAAWLWSQCPKNAANIQMPLLLLGHRFRPRALIEDIITMAMLLHIKYMEDCLKWLELYCNSVYTLNRVVICYLN